MKVLTVQVLMKGTDTPWFPGTYCDMKGTDTPWFPGTYCNMKGTDTPWFPGTVIWRVLIHRGFLVLTVK